MILEGTPMPMDNRNPTHTKTMFWMHIKEHNPSFRENAKYTCLRPVSVMALGNETLLLN